VFIRRKNYNEAISLYEQWMHEDAIEIATLKERVAYLENEREAIRLASLASTDEPITVLVTEHAEAIADHDKAVAAHDENLAVHDKAVAEHDRRVREDDEDIARWENDGGAVPWTA
jgi:chromosome segregation ATPase